MSKTASGVLVRFGEVFLKKGRKGFFLDSLAGNLERAMVRVDPSLKLTRPYGRFLAVPREEGARIQDPGPVADALAGTFGAVWAGPVEIVTDLSLNALDAAVADFAKTHRRRAHKTFRMETRRSDKSFPLNSMELNARLGGVVLDTHEDIRVDLHRPDLTISVELRNKLAYIYGAGVQGVGGLPTGSNGRALLLLSGGIDSPVAGWLTQKRGVAVDAITFLSPPYTGPKAREKVVTLARILAKKQKTMRLWVVELTPIQERYRDRAPADQLVLLYRRSMFRIADAIAQANKHGALVTGESLGQVASQTLANLHCIATVVDSRPVLRPLVTYDKHETITLARKIGTYETSVLPYDDCCSLFVPQHPELKGKPAFLERLEANIEPQALEEAALAGATLEQIA